MTSRPADIRMEPKTVALDLKPTAGAASSGYRRLPKRWRHDLQVLKPSAPTPKVCPRCGGHLYSDMSDDALTLTCLSCGHSVYPQSEAKRDIPAG